jgi:hypothetical protein
MKRAATASALLVWLLISTAPAVAQDKEVAEVRVLHALPRFTADVYVNGDLLLSGFRPVTATDVLELPAGAYDIAVRPVGAAPSSEPVLQQTLTIRGGDRLSIIAGLTPDGEPTLRVFTNDLSAIGAGKTRVIVRNVARTDALELLLDGTQVSPAVPNGGERSVDVPAGAHSLALQVRGGDRPVAGPRDVRLDEGTAHVVYAIGSFGDRSFGLMSETISGLHSPPSGVFTGTGGLAARRPAPAWSLVLMAAGLAVAAAAVARLLAGRTRRPVAT